MFSFILVQNAVSTIEETFSSTKSCDCDLTYKCDPFCCCDKDCNESAISSFKERFCIPESATPTVKITCDTKNKISKAKYVGSFVVNDEIKCYYIEKQLTEGDKIRNFGPEELGLKNFEENLPSPTIPPTQGANTEEYPLFNGTAGYIPFGIGSRSCNSLFLVRKGIEYNTECFLLPSSIPSEGDMYDYTEFLPSYLCNTATCKALGGGKMATITTDVGTGNVNIDLRSSGEVGRIKFSYTRELDANSVPTPGSGYMSGLDLVSVMNLGGIPQYVFLEFAGQRVPFQGNSQYFLALGGETSSDILFTKHDIHGRKIEDKDYPNLFPAYANFPLGQTSRYANFKVPKFEIKADDDAKHVIYTFMYKKFGYKTAFFYKFVGVDMDIVNESSKLYHTIEIKQVELNDDGTEKLKDEDVASFDSLSLNSITDFMFSSIDDIITTTGLIALVILIVLIWMDHLFHQ